MSGLPDVVWRKSDSERYIRKPGTELYYLETSRMATPYLYSLERLMETGEFSYTQPMALPRTFPEPKSYTITVNGRDYKWEHEIIPYEEVVALANTGRTALHSVTYFWRGDGDVQRSGILYPEKSVAVADKMRFTAVVTDNA
jgi:hypothetical protein